MATGPKHYEIAATLLQALADDMQAGHINTEQDVAKAQLVAAQAQAHATLAHVASNLTGSVTPYSPWMRLLIDDAQVSAE